MPLMFTTRQFARLAFITLSFVSVAQAAERDVRVLNSEPVTLDFQSPRISETMKAGTSQTGSMKASPANALRFSAFGKNYTASLTINASIEIPSGSSAEAYKGSIDGHVNSWVRITRSGGQVHGLIFDGSELLALEPAEDIGATSQGTAIFRLADTQTDVGAEFCSSLQAADESSGLALFKSLSGESKAMLADMQKSGARTRLRVSALMDWAFRTRYPSEAAANDAIVARINNVDGIFTSQLGVEVELSATVAPESQTVRVFNSTNSEAMLQAVAQLRSQSPTLYSAGTTHLFTGSDMDGKTIGIAYMDAVCGQRYAASLSEARDRGAWFDSLVAAHELGHGFGSPHDGEGECATTPTSFLMSPTVGGTDRFSQCSLNRIQSRMQSAACLIPIPMANISLPSTVTDRHAQLGAEINWTIPVANSGNGESNNSRLQIVMPAALNVIAANVSGGSCSVGGGMIDCDLGTVAAYESRDVELTLRGTLAGSHAVSATASAASDFDPLNNAMTATFRIDPPIDVGLTLEAPATASIDQPFTATFSVVNKSGSNATNVAVNFVLPSGLTLNGTAQFDGIACQLQFQTLRCSTASMAAGRTVSGSLSLVARESGTQILSATLEGDLVDPQPLDNTAQKSIVVALVIPSANASAPPASQESGGGSTEVSLLALLGILASSRRKIRSLVLPAAV